MASLNVILVLDLLHKGWPVNLVITYKIMLSG